MPENDFLMHYGRSARNGAPGRGSGRYAWGSKNNVRGSASSKKTSTVSDMTDDELRNRINRLNMEEQYANLLARKKERETSTFKKVISKALSSVGEKLTGAMIDAFVRKVTTSKKESTTMLKDDLDTDIKNMDDDTIRALTKLYENADVISKGRKKYNKTELNPESKAPTVEDLKPLAPSKSSKRDKKSRWDDSLW